MSSCRLRDTEVFDSDPRPADKPAIVPYNPPKGFTTWAAIVLNLTVTSKGTQFDRLASLSLNNVESEPLSNFRSTGRLDSADLRCVACSLANEHGRADPFRHRLVIRERRYSLRFFVSTA